MSQGTLDLEPRRVDASTFGKHHRDASPTELRAAAKQVAVSGKKRVEVLRAIVSAGDVGLTRNEIGDRFGIYLPTVCGRVRELLDGGWIVTTKRERQNRAVLIATARGRRAVA